LAPKVQRTSKTSQKLVVLPSAPQTKPLHAEEDEDLAFGYETDAGVREYKSQAERMTKEQRKRAGFRRITVYCVCESLKMKLLSSFLKREHNVAPRVFDEAIYVVCPGLCAVLLCMQYEGPIDVPPPSVTGVRSWLQYPVLFTGKIDDGKVDTFSLVGGRGGRIPGDIFPRRTFAPRPP
jgi:uncharacterized Rmd1/YagE family protein